LPWLEREDNEILAFLSLSVDTLGGKNAPFGVGSGCPEQSSLVLSSLPSYLHGVIKFQQEGMFVAPPLIRNA
jgi:hypothetical protein